MSEDRVTSVINNSRDKRVGVGQPSSERCTAVLENRLRLEDTIHDGFEVVKSTTPYPSFWGHDATEMTTLAQQPNKYLEPLTQAKRGRNLRRVESLWPFAGKIMFAERMWLTSQRLVAVRLPVNSLSNVWWSFAFKAGLSLTQYPHPDGTSSAIPSPRDREGTLKPVKDCFYPLPVFRGGGRGWGKRKSYKDELAKDYVDKALILWMNSTLGLLILFATRDETRGAWVGFKKPSLTAMPVLDIRALSDEQLTALAAAYDEISTQPLQPFPKMAEDTGRAAIDAAIGKAMGLPDFSALRTLLAREPVVSMKRI